MEPLIVEGKLDSLKEIAKYITSATSSIGLDKKASYGLRLAVDEIATNIIVHGYEESQIEGVIKIFADINEATLTVTLEDSGIPYDPTSKSPQEDLDTPIEQRQIGGLGVHLALQNVDAFHYKRTEMGNVNIFIINRPVQGG